MDGEEPEFKEIPIPQGKVPPLAAKKFEMAGLQEAAWEEGWAKELVKADKFFRGLKKAGDDVVGLLYSSC